ncbi:MAG: autotransporter assembly complex family protein [Betaproteobacteria bacterium]
MTGPLTHPRAARQHRSWLGTLVGATVLLLASPVPPAAGAADDLGYTVVVNAPPALKPVLESNLDLVRWSKRKDVGEDQFRQLFRTAPAQVRDLLATEGYFTPSVITALDRAQDRWVARLEIDPGEPTRVSEVEMRFSGPLEPDRQTRARGAFDLAVGAVFRQADWETAKQRPVHALHRYRFAAARIVASEAAIDPQARTARLSVDIDSGPPFSFGSLRVTGLQRYPERIVTTLSPIAPGSPYDEEQLLRFQRRLQASGYFASAVVFAGNDPAEASATPVDVAVVEAAARKLEFSTGVSTDRGPRAQVQYTDRNLLDRAVRYRGSVRIDRLSQEAILGLSLPRQDSGHVFGLEGQYNYQDIQGEERTNWITTLARTYAVETRESQQGVQLLTERRILGGTDTDRRQALFLIQTWRWNNLDDLLAPREGYYVSLQAGGARQGLLSNRSFGRLHLRTSYLHSVSKSGTLLLRAELGSVLATSREQIPSAYLFRTGGDTSVRGYPLDSLGVAEGGAIVGGRYLAIASAEYIQWIRPQWGIAAFVDGGNATDQVDAYRAVFGYGLGARWSSPIGSLNLDVAYGAQISDWRVHLSAGLVLR